MRSSESINELAAALSVAQGTFPAIKKTKTAKVTSKRTGETYTYSYADLEVVVKETKSILAENGLAVMQLPEIDESGRDVVTTTVMHKSGQWKEASTPIKATDGSPQTYGSALTYARRYAYCAALGIVAEEDDDGKRAQEAADKGQTRNRKPPASSTSAVPQTPVAGAGPSEEQDGRMSHIDRNKLQLALAKRSQPLVGVEARRWALEHLEGRTEPLKDFDELTVDEGAILLDLANGYQ